MSKPSLAVILLIVLSASFTGACEFYTAGTPFDGGITDAQDVDRDGAFLDGATVVDAEIQVDAGPQLCGDVGGICPVTPNAICPVGTRPYGEDESLDCDGHCCVPDPISSCNTNPDTNCSMAAACTGCWAPAEDTSLACDGGRVCCEWTCGG
jgi:hypothetical protein